MFKTKEYKMKRLNIAMLGEQQQPLMEIDENNESLKTDQYMAQIQQADSDIEEITQVIEETQDASQAMTNMADKIEQTETVSQDTVAVAQEAITYFVKRTGLKMIKLNASMESYSKTTDKQAVVEQMRLATESLNKSIAIAQEGVIDRIKNKFSLMFTSADKLRKELDKVSKQFDEGGAKTELIKDPAFARVLNPKGLGEITPTDTIALAKEVLRVSSEDTMIKTVKEMSDLLDKVTLSLNRSTFIAKDEEIDKLQNYLDDFIKIHNEIRDNIDYESKSNKANAQPLTKQDKDKLKAMVVDLLDTARYEKAEDVLTDSVDGFDKVYHSNLESRLAGVFAADMKAVRSIYELSYKTYNIVDKIMEQRFEIAHACVKYIKASTN
jgi:hypothetical protein